MSTNLGDLLKQVGFEHSGRAEPEPQPPDPGALFGPKVVLRVTKKGRGGKKVTEVQGVLRDHADLAKQLGKKLGVGTTVDGELLVVQGDQVARLRAFLKELGAKNLV